MCSALKDRTSLQLLLDSMLRLFEKGLEHTRIVKVPGSFVAGAVARLWLKGICLPLVPLGIAFLERNLAWRATLAGALAMGLCASPATLAASRENMAEVAGMVQRVKSWIVFEGLVRQRPPQVICR
jgi:hypothetical protein